MAKTVKKSKVDKIIPATNVPPSSPEVEAAVLGAMLIDKEAVAKVLNIVSADTFYVTAHKIIFEAMISLFEANELIDTVTVYEELRKRNQIDNIGGAAYLSQLAQNVSSPAMVEFHSKIIVEKHILRSLINNAHLIEKEAYEGSKDAFEILDDAERRIFEISEKQIKRNYQDMQNAVKQALEYIEAIHQQHYNTFAVPSGFYELDQLLGGFQRSDLIIVAARPSMGKTAFALSIARNAAVEHQIPIGIFSLEMSTIQLIIRLLCAEARVNAHAVRTGKLPKEEGSKLSKNAHKLFLAPIYVDDSPAQTVLEIRAKSRRLKAEKNVGMIIIDYLQLMQGPPNAENREKEISHISRSLKSLAKELNIPVIALAQLNRAVEARRDKRPILSDLRESGSIEQDADVVIFLNRPEVYELKTDEDGNPTEGIAEVIIGKQRNGPTGKIRLAFIKEYARFENLAHARQIEEYVQISDEDVF
jgi:replicative DNA helicase